MLDVAAPTTAVVRPMWDTDGEALVRFHHRLSEATIYFRFFSCHPELHPEEVERFTHVDHRDREAFVIVDDAGEIVGVGRFDHVPGTNDAEAAFVVADAWQGRGLGRLLLATVIDRARDVGYDHLVAETLATNHRMLRTFRHCGLPVRTALVDGVVDVVIDLALDDGV
jgi:GNAT superfamily N-acetyltransferase